MKPIFSREGQTSPLSKTVKRWKRLKPYGEEGMIVRAFYQLPKFGDSYTLIGSWLINDQPAGIGIREDRALITQDLSRFYPHILLSRVRPDALTPALSTGEGVNATGNRRLPLLYYPTCTDSILKLPISIPSTGIVTGS